jgi:hypothetical protein
MPFLPEEIASKESQWEVLRDWYSPPTVSFYRFVKEPTKERALQVVAVPGIIFASLSLMVYFLDKQAYRTISSLVFEAVFNRTPVQAMLTSAKVAAAPVSVVTFVALGTWANHWTRESIHQETGGSGWNYTTPFTSGFGTVVV